MGGARLRAPRLARRVIDGEGGVGVRLGGARLDAGEFAARVSYGEVVTGVGLGGAQLHAMGAERSSGGAQLYVNLQGDAGILEQKFVEYQHVGRDASTRGCDLGFRA